MNDMTDLSKTIVAKSDQLNADDLLSSPITITVTAVKGGSNEQPVIVHYEGDSGHPFKPCKTVRRVLVAAWGKNGNNWIGRSMTLYTDPTVKFGGVEVGGIRVSHLSHIDNDMSISLNATKGKKGTHIIKRMQVQQNKPAASQTGTSGNVTAEQVELLKAALQERGVESSDLIAAAADHLDLPIVTLEQIPADFYGKACGWIKKQKPILVPSDFDQE